MKLLAAILCVLFATNLSASHFGSANEEKECIVINSENLEVNEEGIFINREGEWVQLKAIFHDTNNKLLGSTSEWSVKWVCPNCGHINGPIRNRCEECGYQP